MRIGKLSLLPPSTGIQVEKKATKNARETMGGYVQKNSWTSKLFKVAAKKEKDIADYCMCSKKVVTKGGKDEGMRSDRGRVSSSKVVTKGRTGEGTRTDRGQVSLQKW